MRCLLAVGFIRADAFVELQTAIMPRSVSKTNTELYVQLAEICRGGDKSPVKCQF